MNTHKHLEEPGVPQGQLDNFANLGQLLAHTSNVVIPDVVELLLVIAFDGLTFAEDDRIGCYDAKVAGVHLHNLELHCTHGSTHEKEIVFAHRTIRLQEIGLPGFRV
jgi:hypothetical protein